ncbi:MAG: PP2C family protein-serine/threonine phosphatase [Chlamydiae bacterium]|nr:PP2C family protein-serine/threonine phosphatase [Chlamydiota bacterium]
MNSIRNCLNTKWRLPSYVALSKGLGLGNIGLPCLFCSFKQIGKTWVPTLITAGFIGVLGLAISRIYRKATGSEAALPTTKALSAVASWDLEGLAGPVEPEKAWLNADGRENRIRTGPDAIKRKLTKELAYAKEQKDIEEDKGFAYQPATGDIQGRDRTSPTFERHNVLGRDVGICHFIGKRAEMEDEHLATSFDLKVGGEVYPVSLFGVFDGHGGGQASAYVRDNLQKKLVEMLIRFCPNELTNEGIWNALKLTFVGLNKDLAHPRAGTTATVSMILDGKLWTANVGDSRTILDDATQLSEDAKPNDSRYRQGIEDRGGIVTNRWNDAPRINRVLAVGRAIGDHLIRGVDDNSLRPVSARPKITMIPLSEIELGTHLILACDGIYDVASTRQVAQGVKGDKDGSSMQLAQNIVHSAYMAGSKDNLSALVVKL